MKKFLILVSPILIYLVLWTRLTYFMGMTLECGIKFHHYYPLPIQVDYCKIPLNYGVGEDIVWSISGQFLMVENLVINLLITSILYFLFFTWLKLIKFDSRRSIVPILMFVLIMITLSFSAEMQGCIGVCSKYFERYKFQ